MTDVEKTVPKVAKKLGKKVVKESTKSDEQLLKDAKQRINRLQKKGVKKNDSTTPKKVMKSDKKQVKRGVVYLGHIPEGFFEDELKGFFSQFGKVKRVKVSRSSRTGRSKGYAFIEFAHNDVAKIVAETMNNYLMFERLIKAQYIPPDKVHANLFPKRWITPTCYPTLVRRKQLKAKQNKPTTDEEKNKHRSRIQFKIKRSVNALKEMGLDYAPQVFDPYYEAGEYPAVLVEESDEEKTSTPAATDKSKSPEKGKKGKQLLTKKSLPKTSKVSDEKSTRLETIKVIQEIGKNRSIERSKKIEKKRTVAATESPVPAASSPVTRAGRRITRHSIAPATPQQTVNEPTKLPASKKRASTSATPVGLKKKAV